MADVKKIATRESYGNTLKELAAEGHEDLVVLDADLAAATKTGMFRKAYPDRHFDCGIAEGNMMGVAAGLSTMGYVPFVSSFAISAAVPSGHIHFPKTQPGMGHHFTFFHATPQIQSGRQSPPAQQSLGRQRPHQTFTLPGSLITDLSHDLSDTRRLPVSFPGCRSCGFFVFSAPALPQFPRRQEQQLHAEDRRIIIGK